MVTVSTQQAFCNREIDHVHFIKNVIKIGYQCAFLYLVILTLYFRKLQNLKLIFTIVYFVLLLRDDFFLSDKDIENQVLSAAGLLCHVSVYRSSVLSFRALNHQEADMGSTSFTNPYAIEVIRMKKSELVSGISNTEDLLDLLIANGVLQPDSRAMMSSITAQQEKNSRMLNVLIARGERACRIFFYPCLKRAEPDLYQHMRTYVGGVNEGIKDARRQLIGYLLEKDKQGLVKYSKSNKKLNPERIQPKSIRNEATSSIEQKQIPKSDGDHDAILRAISSGDLHLLQELIKGLDVNSSRSSSDTLLHLAAEYGKEAVVYFLLRQGAKLNLKDTEGRTALHRASERGHTAVALALVKAGADIHATDHTSKTPLHLAAQNQHESTVKTLVLEEKKSLKNQTTVLHMAAIEDEAKLAEVLLRNGALVDTRDGQRKTALYHAVRHGNEKAAAVLLKAGAQVDSVIVDAAFEQNRKSLLSLFLRYVQMSMSQNEMNSALFKAVRRNLDGVVAALIDHGADVNSFNELGYTPVLLAAELGNAEAFKVLVSKKARLDERLPNQISALHLAIQSGSMQIAQVNGSAFKYNFNSFY